MGYPDGIGAIDLMIGFPFKDKKATYDYLRAGIKDTGDDASVMPAGYMFKDTPDEAGDADPVDTTFGQMDKWGVAAGLFGVNENSIEAKKRHPNRVFFSIEVDPNDITGAVRKIRDTTPSTACQAVTSSRPGASRRCR